MFIIPKNIWWISCKLSHIFRLSLYLSIQCLFFTKIRFKIFNIICMLWNKSFSYSWSLCYSRIRNWWFIKNSRLHVCIFSKSMIVLIEVGWLVDFGKLHFIICKCTSLTNSNFFRILIILSIKSCLKVSIRINFLIILNSRYRAIWFSSENIRILWFFHIEIMNYNRSYLNIMNNFEFKKTI